MYGGRFPDYALHSMHTQLQNMDYSEAEYTFGTVKRPDNSSSHIHPRRIFRHRPLLRRRHHDGRAEADNMRRMRNMDHHRLVSDYGSGKRQELRQIQWNILTKTHMNKKILIATLIAASSTAAAFAQDGLLKKYAQRLSTPRNYVCYRTTEKIKIDGKLNERSWNKAAETESFVDISGEGFPKPIYDTKARMMWDNDYLYVAAVMEEPNIVGHFTQRDTIIYHENDFEVFIDPTGDGQNYFEIENNARGVVFDLMLDRAYRSGGNFYVQWDCPGLKLAVSHDGTLNKEKDKDRSWTVEMAIPHKAITRNFTNPLVAGNIWRLNFSRVEWLKKGGPEENWVWTPTGEINMHAPNQWGFLQFSDKNVGGETEEFRCPYNMEAYKLLWAMFYAQLDNREKQGAFTSSTALLGVTDSDLATLPKGSNVNIEATSTLFSISVRVGGTGKTYVVDQNGKFEVK